MERKNYLGLGIVLAIFAAVISLMCIAFSYADVNELNATENAEGEQIEAVVGGEEQNETTEEAVEDAEENTVFTITLNISAPEGSIGQISYDGSPLAGTTITTSDCSYFELTAGSSFKDLTINEYSSTNEVINGKSLSVASITKGYETTGWSYTSGRHESDCSISLTVKAITGVNLIGKVTDESNNPIPNAYVQFKSLLTTDLLETTTGASGNFAFTNIPVGAFPTTYSGDCPELYVVALGYSLDEDYFALEELKEGTNVLDVGTRDLSLADIVISGAEHHLKFQVTQERTITGRDPEIYTYTLPYFGMAWMSVMEGMEFTIDNDGSVSATLSQSSFTMKFSVKPYCEDGYLFDFINFNGQNYYAGNTITLTADVEKNFVFNYKGVSQPENVTAQTGDAIPYAVIAGLGLLAVFAFVVARKQYNK